VNKQQSLRAQAAAIVIGLLTIATFSTSAARAEALLLVEADTGKVLRAENATYPWYPASVTKLMTAYVTLQAVKEHRITLDTLFTVSRNAIAQSPTKMGFPVGTQVTVDNALKMLMVKSANDMAVLLAEGVSGSIENFAELMTQTAHRLGMTESNFVNPNGLPAEGQVTSARDLAILARALLREFPEYDYYWHIPAIKFGRRVIRNYNPLLGRYPGTDGMKTGFICASGFNLVATASRNGKRLIAVVLGAPSNNARAIKAAELLESGFAQNPLSWLTPSLGTVDSLTPVNASPPNLHDEICGGHRKRPAAEDEEEEANNQPGASDPHSPMSVLMSSLRAPTPRGAALLSDQGIGTPVVVYTGPTRSPAEVARLNAIAEAAAAHRKKKGGTAVGKAGEEKANGKHQAAAALGGDAKAANGRAAARKAVEIRTSGPVGDKTEDGKPVKRVRWTPMSSSALAASPAAGAESKAKPHKAENKKAVAQ
jgi:D-alanyl-D-alanine carboxypeptidase